MRRRKIVCVVAVTIASLLAIGVAEAGALGSTIEAQGCSAAIGGSVSGTVNVICGIPPGELEVLVKERTKPLEDQTTAQRETIATLKKELDVNEAQIRAVLNTLGERIFRRSELLELLRYLDKSAGKSLRPNILFA